MQASNISGEQVLALLGNGNTSGFEKMQIDYKDSDEPVIFDMEDDEDNKDNRLFHFNNSINLLASFKKVGRQ